ncbi:MAG: PsiF family protein [Gallionella sp.]|nr:PsiF family protein [Gallionella sp.]
MKKMIVLACLGFAFTVSAPAFAAGEKMKGCSKEATGMKGDERKAFMKKCLSKDYTLKADTAGAKPAASAATPAAAPVTQQDKMKKCNADAKTKELKGDERKKFMSTCLKG